MGLRSEDWWELTGREQEALRSVHEDHLRRWALERAMYANAHFRQHDKEGVYTDPAWEADDFLGLGDRAARAAQMNLDRIAAAHATAALAKIKPGAKPNGLPAWALGPKTNAN